MKIEPTGDNEKTEKNSNFFKNFNIWKIRFRDLEIENKYCRFVGMRDPGFQEKSRNLVMLFCQLAVLVVYLITYLLQIESDSVKKSLKFRLALVVFCIFILIALVFVQSRYSKKFNVCCSALLYLMLGVMLILNSTDFQRVIFDDPTELNLNCLPGLIIIIFLYSFSSIPTFFTWLGCNTALLILFGAIRIPRSDELASGLLEFFLLLISALAQQALLYINNLSSRIEYFYAYNSNIEENEKLCIANDDLSNKLKKCIQNLTNILTRTDTLTRSELENAIQLLSAISEYRTRNNTEFNLELIANGLDEDDRLYIQQSWTNFQVLNIRKREKIKNKNLNKAVHKYISPDILLIIKQLGISWNVNMFELNDKSENQPILYLGRFAFEMYNLLSTFKIPEVKLADFLQELQSRYKPNPYHNAIHAADILASGLYIINSSFIQSNLTDLEMVAIILAHIAHDVGHPGYTNRFLINFQDDLAMQCNTYIDNDISILENMHASLTFSILRTEKFNILSELEPDQFILTRKWLIELILATDMGKHFELLRLFKSNSYEKKSFSNADIRLEVLKILIKAADIGHSAKMIDIHKKWSLLISEEFFRQGDIEKESGKPVSMYCDRDTTFVPKSQIGFLKNIALPLYENLGGFLDSEGFSHNCVEQIRGNISSWEYECLSNKNLTLKDSTVKSILSENAENVPLYIHKSSIVLCKSSNS